MKGGFRIPVYAAGGGGSNPDPAIYCPANGYIDPEDPDSGFIPNPLTTENGWNLLCSFQTNSPHTTTFDPTLTVVSGQYAWDLGDGSILQNMPSISYTYQTTETRTVKLYGKGICSISKINFQSDNIVGLLDLSNSAFSALTSVLVNSNPAMTNIIVPPSVSGMMTEFNAAACNLTGELNLAGISTVSNIILTLNSNPALTNIVFNPEISGSLYQLLAYSCNLTGTLNLSMFTSVSSLLLWVYSNPNLTGMTFAESVTGGLGAIWAYSCNLTGTLNMSMFTDANNGGMNIQVYSNPNLTGLTFAPALSTYPLLQQLLAYSCNLTGTLNLSMFTSFTASANIRVNSNPNLSGITFTPTTITAGKIQYLFAQDCAIPYVDLTKIGTSFNINSAYWSFKNNAMSKANVNRMLVELNNLATSGFTSRSFIIDGTNGYADSSSGGYDGLTAKTSMQSKSITVTTTLVAPTLAATTSASNITNNSATSGGNVTDGGSSSVTARGVCYSTSQNPTVSGSKTTDGTGTGSFTSTITGLVANRTYYVRAYATNGSGTSYGTQISFTTLP